VSRWTVTGSMPASNSALAYPSHSLRPGSGGPPTRILCQLATASRASKQALRHFRGAIGAVRIPLLASPATVLAAVGPPKAPSPTGPVPSQKFQHPLHQHLLWDSLCIQGRHSQLLVPDLRLKSQDFLPLFSGTLFLESAVIPDCLGIIFVMAKCIAVDVPSDLSPVFMIQFHALL
jgi:hypothetical protein